MMKMHNTNVMCMCMFGCRKQSFSSRAGQRR